ncbi:MAG: Ribonuclease [Candidatus Kaiserbacteria bacterium]|nr:Ribonuclease [Candidatus Kaiserbacteria bacterium]
MTQKSRMTRADIERVLKSKTRRVRTALFSAIFCPSVDGAPTQYATVVSKKIARHAVDRNRIKRRMRAALQHVSPPVHSYFIVLYPLKTVATVPHDVLMNEVQSFLQTLS